MKIQKLWKNGCQIITFNGPFAPNKAPCILTKILTVLGYNRQYLRIYLAKMCSLKPTLFRAAIYYISSG